MNGKELFNFLNRLETEQRNPSTMRIDIASSTEIVDLINAEDLRVAASVAEKKDVIASVIDAVAAGFIKGGRLIYAGAGTSGRLGVIDAAECPPTFGTSAGQVIGLIAGGEAAMFVAQEGAEDSEAFGAEAIADVGITENDIVVGLAASGRTPYVWGALDGAAKKGATTVLVCCVSADRLPDRALPLFVIDVVTGPEVIMGSTRMKAATAQKMVCNMISTGAMIRLGKVFENVMVDLKLTNRKLVERAIRIVMMFTKLSYEEAAALLSASGNHVKTAIVMHNAGVDRENASLLLKENDGFIAKALQAVS
jgi:N-acetylmuramic acid 6-phosphate etherase